jgi:hypothetical protein
MDAGLVLTNPIQACGRVLQFCPVIVNGGMDKFIARENVKHLRDQIRSEIDPNKRAVLQRILVEEEDRLGATNELIANIEREVATSRKLIAEHRALIASSEREQGDGLEQARALLDGLGQSLALHEEYHRRLVKRL